MDALNIDTPFNCRFTCWFCGEGSHKTVLATLSTPLKNYLVNIPICDECNAYQCHNNIKSLKKLEEAINEKIVLLSAKELAIGANWTEKELQESELNGGAFDGFKKSGWPMYLIAKKRVNYNGWELCIDGIPVDYKAFDETHEFDGLTFSSFTSMLDYLSHTFSLHREFLKKVLLIYGNNRAIEAVKLCRLVPNESKEARDKAVENLIESFKEKDALG